MSLIRYIIIFTLIGCWSFFFGFKMAQERGLDHCKEAGWEFIQERLLIPESKERLEIVRHLQADIATKCIVRFE